MLVFPAKSSDAVLSRSFEDRNFNRFSVNSAVGAVELVRCNRLQGGVVNRFDESISQRNQSCPKRADVFRGWNVLLRLGNDRPIVDNRSAGNGVCAVVNGYGGVDEYSVCLVAYAKLGKLARSARDRILVAFGACSSVINRTESV